MNTFKITVFALAMIILSVLNFNKIDIQDSSNLLLSDFTQMAQAQNENKKGKKDKKDREDKDRDKGEEDAFLPENDPSDCWTGWRPTTECWEKLVSCKSIKLGGGLFGGHPTFSIPDCTYETICVEVYSSVEFC